MLTHLSAEEVKAAGRIAPPGTLLGPSSQARGRNLFLNRLVYGVRLLVYWSLALRRARNGFCQTLEPTETRSQFKFGVEQSTEPEKKHR